MDEVKRFFHSEVNRAMVTVGLKHFLIQDFLVDLLASYVAKSDVFVVRKDPMVAFAWTKNTPEAEAITKKLLFITGIFPDSLKMIGRRQVGVGYYIGITNIMARRLSPEKPIWAEINKYFKPTIKTLLAVRAESYLSEMDIITCSELISALGDPLLFC